jgi:hypothetical protein
VQRVHYLGQFGQRKAHLGAGSEMLQAKIDGIRAGLDGSVQLRPVAGGAHDFRFNGVVSWCHLRIIQRKFVVPLLFRHAVFLTAIRRKGAKGTQISQIAAEIRRFVREL